MTKAEFQEAIIETPEYAAKFTLRRVPEWATEYLKADDVLHAVRDGLYCPRTGGVFAIGPSFLKFAGYVQINP